MIRNLVSVLIAMFLCLPAYAEKENKSDKTEETTAKESVETEVDENEDEDEEEKPTGPKHPVSGSVTLGHAFNHANFVESDADFGYQTISANVGVSYSPVKSLSLGSSLGVRKMVAPSFLNAGTPSRTTRTPWEISDVGVNASYSNFYKIPVVDIGFSGGLSVSFPATKASQSAGLIAAFTPNLSASWAKAGFSVGLSGSYSYFLNEEPTIQINCDNAPDNCIISGSDTAIPNALHNLSTRANLGYRFLKMFRVGVSYGISVGFSAVEFPDDEFSSPLAQAGTQRSLGRQSFSTNFGVTPVKGTSVSFSMSTLGSLYTNDNKSYRFLLFDTESQLHHRTRYGVSLTQFF